MVWVDFLLDGQILIMAAIGFAATSLAFLLGRSLSRSIEHRIDLAAERARITSLQLVRTKEELSDAEKRISEQEYEIGHLRQSIIEREKVNQGLRDRLKLAERITERDLESTRIQLAKLSATINALAIREGEPIPRRTNARHRRKRRERKKK